MRARARTTEVLSLIFVLHNTGNLAIRHDYTTPALRIDCETGEMRMK